MGINKKITQENAAATLTGAELVRGVQNGVNVKIIVAEIAALSGGAVSSVAGRTGAVVLTSTDVGLPLVNNSPDANKPVSTAQAAADSAVAATAASNLASHVGAADPHTGYALESALATIATSGAYNDLSGKPTLGTAAPLNISTDGTLAANSDTLLATQKAVKAYADQLIASADALVFKAVIDASANPNYPAADKGWTYRISIAGKIGGASGINVEVGDLLLCLADGTASGNQATVGANWSIAQTNIDGGVIGPASATDGNVALFNGASGKVIKDSGLTLAGNNTGDETGPRVATLLHAASNKTALVDADEVNGTDSAASFGLIRTTWLNVKAFLKTYFDALYSTRALSNLSAVAINTDLVGAVTNGMGVRGGTAANDDLTLEGTTNATRTTSYVLIQPNGGNIGVGTLIPSAKLHVIGDCKVGDYTAFAQVGVGGPSTQMNHHGFEDWTVTDASASPNLGYASFDARAELTGSATNDHFVGFQSRPIYSGSGYLANYFDAINTMAVHNGAGTVATATALKITDIGGSGPVLFDYGIFIGNINRGSVNNFALYSAGGKSYFAEAVGINTNAPASMLHIVTPSSATPAITAELTGGGANKVVIYPFNDGNTYLQHDGKFVIAPTGSITPQLTVDTAGFVGVGTLSPSQKLHVSGNILATGYVKTTPVTVATLIAAATAGAGARHAVTDSTVAPSGNFGATVVGGGSNFAPVTSTGVLWIIG